MNTLQTAQRHSTVLPFNLSSTPSAEVAQRIRVAVFGSFLGGYHVLQELLFGPLASRLMIVSAATDDPTQPLTHSTVRLWNYAHCRED